MKQRFLLIAALGVLMALTLPATAQEQIVVDDTTNLGTEYQGWYQCKDYTLKARLTIKGVERKQYYELQIPRGRKVSGVDLIETPAPGTETRRRVIGRSSEDQEVRLRRAEMAAELLGDELDLAASA